MVENPSRDFFHPLGESEIRAKLSSLPIPEELKITHIWLRRTKKGDYEAAQTHQATFIKGSGVWLIVLYAFPKDLKMRFGQRKPEQKELNFYARWTSDLQSDALGWHLVWQEQAIRDYYLNYLLPNEIGHLIESQFFRYYSKARLVRRENFAHEFAIRSLRTTTAFY